MSPEPQNVLTITTLKTLGIDLSTSSARAIGQFMRHTRLDEDYSDLVIADPEMHDDLFDFAHFRASWVDWANSADDYAGTNVLMQSFTGGDGVATRDCGKTDLRDGEGLTVSLFGQRFFASYDSKDEAWHQMFQKLAGINVDHWKTIPGGDLQAHLTARHPQHVKRRLTARGMGPHTIMLMEGRPGSLYCQPFPITRSVRRR